MSRPSFSAASASPTASAEGAWPSTRTTRVAVLPPFRTSPAVGPAALLVKGLELGDDFQISRATGGPLDADEPFQVQTAAPMAEELQLGGVRQQRLEASSAGDLAQEIQVPQGGGEGEVEAPVQGRSVQAEGQPRRSAAQV